jgi:hypothetical protein
VAIAELPTSFAESSALVQNFALEEIVKAARRQQLYDRNRHHVEGVQRRANQIFQAVAPYVLAPDAQFGRFNSAEGADLTRMQHLLDICAVAHDMVQEFVPQQEPHTKRQRESGVSETKTIAQLLTYIDSLNDRILNHHPSSEAVFKNSDLRLIAEAIEATICAYDTARRLPLMS